MKQKPRAVVAKMPKVSRERLDALARLGPWDTHRWGPEGAEDARRAALAEATKPFWTRWEHEAVASIEEINHAFRMHCAASLAMAQDPNRVPRHPGEMLSESDQETYQNFRDWLIEMHHAGLKSYIGMVRNVVVLEEGTREPGIFRRAINLHVAVRRRS